jgi:hypothetical protein
MRGRYGSFVLLHRSAPGEMTWVELQPGHRPAAPIRSLPRSLSGHSTFRRRSSTRLRRFFWLKKCGVVRVRHFVQMQGMRLSTFSCSPGNDSFKASRFVAMAPKSALRSGPRARNSISFPAGNSPTSTDVSSSSNRTPVIHAISGSRTKRCIRTVRRLISPFGRIS